MNFSFWPFLWFGLPGRLLIHFDFVKKRCGNRRVFRLAGEARDHFHCAVEPSPGHIRRRKQQSLARHFWVGGGGQNRILMSQGKSQSAVIQELLPWRLKITVWATVLSTSSLSLSLSLFFSRIEGVIGLVTEWPRIVRYFDTIAAIPHIAQYFLREVTTHPEWCDTLLST